MENLTGWQKIERVVEDVKDDENAIYVSYLKVFLDDLKVLKLSFEEKTEGVILNEAVKEKIKEALSRVLDFSAMFVNGDDKAKVAPKIKEGADIIKNLFPEEEDEEKYIRAFIEICDQMIENAGELLFQALKKDKAEVGKMAQELTLRLKGLVILLRV